MVKRYQLEVNRKGTIILLLQDLELMRVNWMSSRKTKLLSELAHLRERQPLEILHLEAKMMIFQVQVCTTLNFHLEDPLSSTRMRKREVRICIQGLAIIKYHARLLMSLDISCLFKTKNSSGSEHPQSIY